MTKNSLQSGAVQLIRPISNNYVDSNNDVEEIERGDSDAERRATLL